MEDLPGEDLKTYAFKGTVGRDGLELQFDSLLQGKTGGAIYRVDPAGFRVNPPRKSAHPFRDATLYTSLDIDLQTAAEKTMQQFDDFKGAAVALDVRTGEVLVLASKPDYDLNEFSPRLSAAAAQDINEREAWTNLAISGVYPPGSTFKLVTTLAGLRSGRLTPDDSTADCDGTMRIGGRTFYCDNGRRPTTASSRSAKPSPRAAISSSTPTVCRSAPTSSPPRPAASTSTSPPASTCPTRPAAC